MSELWLEELVEPLPNCGWNGSVVRRDRNPLCETCGRDQSCIWGALEEHAARACHVQTGTCRHTCSSRTPEKVCRVRSCTGWGCCSYSQLPASSSPHPETWSEPQHLDLCCQQKRNVVGYSLGSWANWTPAGENQKIILKWRKWMRIKDMRTGIVVYYCGGNVATFQHHDAENCWQLYVYRNVLLYRNVLHNKTAEKRSKRDESARPRALTVY